MGSLDGKPISVLFVCLGNICRSPMAEAVFRHHATSWPSLVFDTIDSAGTGAYHVGSPPDGRTVSTLRKHSIPCQHAARLVQRDDFTTFDYILAMDDMNLEDLQDMRAKVLKNAGAKAAGTIADVRLFGDFNEDGTVCEEVGGGEVVPDPYYGAKGGFGGVYQQLTRFSTGFLQYLSHKHGDAKE